MPKMYSIKVRAVCLIDAHHVEAESEEALKDKIASQGFVNLWAEIPSLESIKFEGAPSILHFKEE